MKFKQGTRRKAIEYEKDLVNYWRDNKIFEKSVQQRPAADSYVFYDGPPFITGVPHHGTLLSSIVKDAVPRYQTMKGKRVERVWGWDCHGLPAENFVEKKLGITDRHDIGTKISLEDYIRTARESMVQTSSEWEDTIDRIGRWVDFKGAYKTMDKEYMESVWWAFKKLYEAGKIYEGEKVLMYDTKWATPLSKAEVTMDAGAYQVVTDPSVYVKFKLKNFPVQETIEQGSATPAFLLAWTTTPWTLPGNTAVGVGKNETYAEVEVSNGDHLILLASLIDKVLTDEKHQPVPHKVVRDDIKGHELIGLEYEPLLGVHRGENAHRVWDYPDLSTDDGSGIVHLAPAYGEEDFELAHEKGIPVVHVLDEYGNYTEGDWKGENVWEINKTIAKDLHARGIVWKIDYIQHEYPHNLRNGNRLMYRAHPSWFMDIDGQRTEMLEENTEHINWFPEYIKHGRFEKTILQAPDWNLSRDRFWATAMPVWKSDDGDIKVVGSYAELKELSGVELEDYHRPWIDDVEFDFEGKHYKRIDKVLDCWFESGSMPFAQFHYPFENRDKFEQNFPGDFIVEYVGQVRAWFYYVHAVNVGLFGHNAFKNVIVTGNLMGSDGFKLSKSRGNFTDPSEVFDRYSVDAWRLFLLASPVMKGEDVTLIDKDVQDVQRKLAMIWNMYDFFTLYASVDGWEWDGKLEDPYQDLTHPLDQWIVSRVHELTAQVEEHMDNYDIPSALKGVLPFVDDASNWYIRRSRKRFWKSDNDTDKDMAYRTLHYILARLSLVLAPFTPFLADELYRNLTGGESVHLCDWPPNGQTNGLVLEEMVTVRDLITQGLAQRAEAGIRVRQPLQAVTLHGLRELKPELADIVAEELNVKEVKLDPKGEIGVTISTKITPELRQEGLMRELIRHIQNARKNAGLNVDDRIELDIKSNSDSVNQAFKNFKTEIFAETLAASDHPSGNDHSEQITLDGAEVTITLAKVKS
ncbi:MAG TPA: isoleucine--tRNA ligase [Candidatus Saccharimonadales bacterium]|nr:isoleucine--tRNA ligase [Candidatus Saccharimonadales bacterium]